MRIPGKVLLLALAVPMAAGQEPSALRLSQAVAIALEKSPARKMAAADVSAAKAGVDQARSSFLPRVNFAETFTYGNDPVYAFGTRLRQGRFTQNDFALGSLNFPNAIGNYSSRIGGQWNIFNSFNDRLQFRRARALDEAAQRQLSRADQELMYRVIDAYYGVLLAARQLEVAEQTLRTAQAVVESTTAKVEAGTAVDADALSAKVMHATRQQETIRARGALEVARTQLETALGARLAPGQQPADALQERVFPPAELEQAEVRALAQRPDLQAIASQVDAQHAGVKAAKAAFGPRLDVFGSWQADNPAFAANGNSNWMTGAELRIDLFAREKNARLAMERATLARVEASRQMAGDNVRMEVRRAYFEYDAARQMLVVARGAVAQAGESMRIVRDRYESGLVPVTELLRAEDAERTSRTNYWHAVYRNVTSYAALLLATGDLNEQSVVVTQ